MESSVHQWYKLSPWLWFSTIHVQCLCWLLLMFWITSSPPYPSCFPPLPSPPHSQWASPSYKSQLQTSICQHFRLCFLIPPDCRVVTSYNSVSTSHRKDRWMLRRLLYILPCPPSPSSLESFTYLSVLRPLPESAQRGVRGNWCDRVGSLLFLTSCEAQSCWSDYWMLFILFF